KRSFLDRLRKNFLLLKTGIPDDRSEGMRQIVRALSGRWSEMAAEEVSQLELALRLEVIRSLEEAGVVARYLRDARSPMKWTRAQIKDARATRSLGDALTDKDADVRSAAVWALGMIADRASAALVEPLLQDSVWYVRAHAAEALGRIGDPNAVQPLAEALKDRSWWVRKNALDALVRLGEPAKPVLLRTLNGEDRFARDCAVEALMTLGMPLPETAVSDGGGS